MAVSKRTRYEVLRRDNNTCRYCHATDTPLTIDHVTPTALGGTDDPSNLVAACKDCNAGKTSTSPDGPLVADISEDALRWSAAMQESARRMIGDLETERAYIDTVDEAWKTWKVDQEVVYRPMGWWNTIAQWHKAGLPVELVRDAVPRAMGSTKVSTDEVWRYFCGIVWKRLKELQATAQAEFVNVPSGEAFQRALAVSARAFPWATRPPLDAESRAIAEFAVQPMRHLANLQARTLSRVVDGAQTWNENSALAELGDA